MVTPKKARLVRRPHGRKLELRYGHREEYSYVWSDWKLLLSYAMVSKVNMVLNVHRNHEAY